MYDKCNTKSDRIQILTMKAFLKTLVDSGKTGFMERVTSFSEVQIFNFEIVHCNEGFP